MVLLFAVRDVAIVELVRLLDGMIKSRKMIGLDGLPLRLCGFCTHLTRNLDIMQFLRAFWIFVGKFLENEYDRVSWGQFGAIWGILRHFRTFWGSIALIFRIFR